MKNIFYAAFLYALTAFLVACSEQSDTTTSCTAESDLEGRCASYFDALALNHIQTVGSHNSYKLAIPPAELQVIAQSSKQQAMSLDYNHIPLSEQLDLGMRQIELDVYYDPEGGRYLDPLLPRITAGKPGSQPYDRTDMEKPGFKTMHVQGIDVRSHCALFISCLGEINNWSLAHPGHVPILIMLNTKQSTPEKVPGIVTALPFDATAFDALDAEIRSIFTEDRLISPDDIRGEAPSLRGAVLAHGWPSLAEARGKVLFALDEGENTVTTYARGHLSLEGLPMFVNSVHETAPHAAYFTLNSAVNGQARIQAAVKAGFLVRTRADANTEEARHNDTSTREAAFRSGAQYISTDYYLPRPELSDYSVRLPMDLTARCNPVKAGKPCQNTDKGN